MAQTTITGPSPLATPDKHASPTGTDISPLLKTEVTYLTTLLTNRAEFERLRSELAEKHASIWSIGNLLRFLSLTRHFALERIRTCEVLLFGNSGPCGFEFLSFVEQRWSVFDGMLRSHFEGDERIKDGAWETLRRIEEFRYQAFSQQFDL